MEAPVFELRVELTALVHEPIVTPWGYYKARLQVSDGLQIILFQITENPLNTTQEVE